MHRPYVHPLSRSCPSGYFFRCRMKSEELVSTLEWRYAAKSFDPNKKIPADQWAALEKALVLTPSSYGLQPWKFLVIQNAELREKLKAASWNQRQVTECSHYIVFLQKTEMNEDYIKQYMARIAEVRGVAAESLDGFRKAITGDVIQGPRSKVQKEWMARQLYIALGNFMTAAATLKVDTCPMEGLDPSKYDEILELHGSGFQTVVACAAGFRNAADPLANAKKVRFPQQKMIENR